MRILKWLDKNFEEYIMMAILALICLVLFLQVVMRYVFNQSLPWPEELCRYSFIWSVFLSMGYCIRRNMNLRIDVFFAKLPQKAQKIADIIIQFIVLAFFAYLFVKAIPTVQKIQSVGQTSPAMGIPMYLVYSAATVGFFLSVLRAIQSIILMIMDIVRGNWNVAEIKGRD